MLRIWIPILPKHIWQNVTAQGGRRHLRQQATRSSAPVPSRRRVQEGQLRAHGGQQGLLARRAAHRRDHLPGLSEPRHDDRRPQDRATSTRPGHPPGAIRPTAPHVGHQGRRLQLPQLGVPLLQLLQRAGLAGATRCCATCEFRRALNWAIDEQKLVDVAWTATPSRGRRSCRRTSGSTPTTTGSRRPTQRYTLRPGQGAADPRRGGLPRHQRRRCARVQRASRSCCACGRRPSSSGAAVARPAWSPASSRSWASRSSWRSSTPAS